MGLHIAIRKRAFHFSREAGEVAAKRRMRVGLRRRALTRAFGATAPSMRER
jgi:hypothetical protein